MNKENNNILYEGPFTKDIRQDEGGRFKKLRTLADRGGEWLSHWRMSMLKILEHTLKTKSAFDFLINKLPLD